MTKAERKFERVAETPDAQVERRGNESICTVVRTDKNYIHQVFASWRLAYPDVAQKRTSVRFFGQVTALKSGTTKRVNEQDANTWLSQQKELGLV